jgi:hypothetical protein
MDSTTADGHWRVGRHLGRTLYVDDQVVGMVDTPELGDAIVAAMNGDGLEQARTEGRREADNAINWTTSCIGCAKQLDSLYAERSAGAEETARFIAAEIRGLYSTSGDRALLEAVAIAERHALGHPVSTHSAQEARNAVPDSPSRQGGSQGVAQCPPVDGAS